MLAGEPDMRVFVRLWLLCMLLVSLARAQTADVTATPLSDTDIQLLRSDLQSGKNRVIADTMKFSESESSAFWPIYRDFARDQQALGDERLGVIKDYAQHLETMNDATAKQLSQRMIDIESKTVNIRRDYWPKFEKALGAKRAAKFYQVDNRLSLMINVQLASEIPLIP
jgi:hypothetical protein